MYIGSTIQKLSNRMACHRRIVKKEVKAPVYEAMESIGVKHFKILLIKPFPCESKEELVAEEYKVMNEYLAKGITLYNQIIDDKMSEKCKAKLSKAVKLTFMNGRESSPEQRKKHSEWMKVNGYNNGRVFTEEEKKKIGDARRGKGSTWLGKKHSEETKENMKEAWEKRRSPNGVVRFTATNKPNDKLGFWALHWRNGDDRKSLAFHVKKYGDEEAHKLALEAQQKQFP